MAATSITYNSYDLNNTSNGVFARLIDDGSAFERELITNKLLRTGGAVITDSTYYTKVVSVSGYLTAASDTALDTLIDTFHAALNTQDANLDIGYAGSTRRYVSTPQKVNIVRNVRAVGYADYDIEFVCTQYGKDTSTTTLLASSGNTTALRTVALTVGGSAPEQFIRVQITITAATGLTDKTIGIENDTTGQRIYIQRTWTVGEVLIFDMANQQVTINGVLYDFEGAFPIFTPGSHNLLIDNDFTTRTLTTVVDYVKRYL